MPQTIAEKIISAHVGRDVAANEIAIVRVDAAMATDATAPFAIKAFRAMGGQKLWNAERFALIIDHAAPAPNERVANLHRLMREFVQATGCVFYEIGEGICHQLMAENGHARAGDIFAGADSHTPTLGALGTFAIGMGSTDLAGVMLTGQTWLKVPQSIRIELNGELPNGVTAKDVVLYLVGQVGADGANYQAIEFAGETVERLTLASRMVLCNMVAEMGAKAGVAEASNLPLRADADAVYAKRFTLDVSRLRPMVSVPHAPDNVQPIDVVRGRKIHYAFIGSCTNARVEDLQAAAAVLKGQRLAPGVRLVIAPASKRVFNEALRDGTLEILSEAGATFITSGCGPCVGSHLGVPGDGEVVISSTNRNFKGRMGNPNAEIYLASPAVVAASAIAGEIVEPAFINSAGEKVHAIANR
ncbi:MAG: 3-isopropylmalate dehydratase large subunit [Anaerolineales bacterium]|nr:3-isopropylmalate dehydratase large subunit [Anaerolineales bacterium]